MPDYNPTAVVEAFRVGLVSKDEAREMFGVGTLAADLAESQKLVGLLKSEVALWDDEAAMLRKKLADARDHARSEYLRGYGHGKRDHADKQSTGGVIPAGWFQAGPLGITRC